MKQFQDWWDKEIDWRVDLLDYTSEVYAEEAWRAALTWILYAGVLTDLPKDLIEEELEITK